MSLSEFFAARSRAWTTDREQISDGYRTVKQKCNHCDFVVEKQQPARLMSEDTRDIKRHTEREHYDV